MNPTRQELDDLLVDYLYDELDAADRAAFERGVAAYPDLAAEVEAHRRTRSMAQALPQVPLSAGFIAGLMARVEVPPASSPAPAPRRSTAPTSPPGFFARLASFFRKPNFAMALSALVVAGVAALVIAKGAHEEDEGTSQLLREPASITSADTPAERAVVAPPAPQAAVEAATAEEAAVEEATVEAAAKGGEAQEKQEEDEEAKAAPRAKKAAPPAPRRGAEGVAPPAAEKASDDRGTTIEALWKRFDELVAKERLGEAEDVLAQLARAGETGRVREARAALARAAAAKAARAQPAAATKQGTLEKVLDRDDER